MKTYEASEALEHLRKNRFAQWCGDSEDHPGHNESMAAVRLRGSLADIQVKPKFSMEEGQSIYAMGSCFAREIELALSKERFDILSFDDAVIGGELFESKVQFGAGSFLFRYTTASMRMEIGRVLGEIHVPDDKLLSGPPEALLDLNFGGNCTRGDLDLIAARRHVTRELGQGLKRADIVVLTLGLTEAWYDKDAGLYINSAPDLSLLRRGQRFELHSLDYKENFDNITACIDMIRAHNKNAKFVITVSPIPLQATFTGEDVIVASMRSKSTLRAVAADITRDDPDALYFPSYEMAMYSDPHIAWKGDRRHVTREMVSHIIRRFKSVHGLGSSVGQNEIALVDLSAERIQTNLSDGGFSIQSGEILLHPVPAPQRASAKFKNMSGKAATSFKSGVLVSRAEANPVKFGVEVCNTSSGDIIATASQICPAGEKHELTCDFSTGDAEMIDITISTEMANPRDATDFAWAQFLSPTLSYGQV